MSKVIDERDLDATVEVRGRTFRIHRTVWTNGLSYDVHDVATDQAINNESWDDEPDASDVESALDDLAEEMRSNGTTGDPFFHGEESKLAEILGLFTVKVENSYTDGHESETTVYVDPPGADLDEWWDDAVFDHTGDGHYTQVFDRTGDRLGSCYTTTILAAPGRPELLGATHEWLD